MARYPTAEGRVQVSTAGGNDSVWSREGRELFYRSGNDLMSVELSSGASITAGPPRRLFPGRFAAGGDRANCDVTPDGRRFVMIRPPEEGPPPTITVVLSWATSVAGRAQ